MKIMFRLASVACLAFCVAGCAATSDEADLTALLQNFLANADVESAHASFWAEDLVYTSSDGSRFGKAEIMAGFNEPGAGEDSEAPGMAYSGEEVDIRLYGDTAIVVFKLVGIPTDESAAPDVLYYFNTGTFLKRDGFWQVVAWQATKIPPQ